MFCSTKRLWAGAGVFAIALSTISCGSSVEGEDPDLIQGRIWFEKLPESKTQYVHALVVASRPKRGAVSKSSAYDIHLEIFEYAREESKVKLKFPQTDKKAEFSYTIKKCDADPFDLCLDLDKNPWGGPKRYYAQQSGGSVEEAAEIAAALQAAAGDD
jgi:hypothetical protein